MVTLAPGASEPVSFSVIKNVAGSYNVEVDGLSSSFEVTGAPLPATFSLNDLSISAATVKSREPVTCSVTVTNTGETEGSYTATLKIDGVEVATQAVTLAGGESRTVEFRVFREEAGSYSVEMGELSRSFTVTETEQDARISWSLLGGIIGAVVVVGLPLVFFLMWRRRAKAATE